MAPPPGMWRCARAPRTEAGEGGKRGGRGEGGRGGASGGEGRIGRGEEFFGDRKGFIQPKKLSNHCWDTSESRLFMWGLSLWEALFGIRILRKNLSRAPRSVSDFSQELDTLLEFVLIDQQQRQVNLFFQVCFGQGI